MTEILVISVLLAVGFALAEDVAQRGDGTMVLIRAGTEGDVFAAWTEPI